MAGGCRRRRTDGVGGRGSKTYRTAWRGSYVVRFQLKVNQRGRAEGSAVQRLGHAATRREDPRRPANSFSGWSRSGASPYQTIYFSIKSTIDVALAWIELTCAGESTSLSLNVVRTVSS
jgi:hypothetical protein